MPFMPLVGFVLLFLELTLLMLVGMSVGLGSVFLQILVTATAGYVAIRRVGRRFQPAQLIGVFLHPINGFRSTDRLEWALFGSLLLIIPGFITDLVGIFFLGRFVMAGGAFWTTQAPKDPIDVDFDVRDDDE